MEEKIFEQFCFDFYGELLSDRQKTILDYYYNEDYNISEIAECLGITRQGAHDAFKRAKAQMAAYETKLGLVSRFLKNRSLLSEINAEFSQLLNDALVQDHDSLYKEIARLQNSIDQVIEGY